MLRTCRHLSLTAAVLLLLAPPAALADEGLAATLRKHIGVLRRVHQQDIALKVAGAPRPGGAHDPPAGSGHGSPPLLILMSELSGPFPSGPVPPGPTARRALSPGS